MSMEVIGLLMKTCGRASELTGKAAGWLEKSEHQTVRKVLAITSLCFAAMTLSFLVGSAYYLLLQCVSAEIFASALGLVCAFFCFKDIYFYARYGRFSFSA